MLSSETIGAGNELAQAVFWWAKPVLMLVLGVIMLFLTQSLRRVGK